MKAILSGWLVRHVRHDVRRMLGKPSQNMRANVERVDLPRFGAILAEED